MEVISARHAVLIIWIIGNVHNACLELAFELEMPSGQRQMCEGTGW